MATDKYYVPESSPWPLTASIGLFMTAIGGAKFIQQKRQQTDVGFSTRKHTYFLVKIQ